MKPAPFDYVRAASVAEALSALSGQEWGARLMAGGQSLVPMLNLRLSPVTTIIDISRITELRGVHEDGDQLVFGACVRHGEFEDGAVPDPAHGMLRHIAGRIAYRAVRNRGTIGGSLSLADPSADWIPAVMSLGASFDLRGPAGDRRVAAADMFLGPYTTALADHDMLVSIRVPKLSAAARWGYHKVIRKTGEYPIVTASVVLDPERDWSRIVLGAVNRGPLQMAAASAVLHRVRDSTWSSGFEAELRAAVGQDLETAGRSDDIYEMKLGETATMRAAQMAMRPQ